MLHRFRQGLPPPINCGGIKRGPCAMITHMSRQKDRSAAHQGCARMMPAVGRAHKSDASRKKVERSGPR